MLYGGAKGGGKSVFGCMWVYESCIRTIKKFNLKPVKFPIPYAFMGRKQSVDFNDTTLETWKQIIPTQDYELRSADKEIIMFDCLKIQYGGFDSETDIKKFNSAEYAIAFIDQAEEISRDDYGLIKGTLRRKINNAPLHYKILLTANPAICWLKDEFITQLSKGNAFVQALPTDNTFLVEGYVDNLREAFRNRPELVAAYVEGNWDIMAGDDIVIKPSWIRKAINREVKVEDKRRVVCCDPARFGDNETVIYVLEGHRPIHSMIYGERPLMETAGNLVALKNKFQCSLIGVDSCGVGAGIVDRLNELREPVLAVNVAEKPTIESDNTKFHNLRSQLTWRAGELFANEEVSLPDNDQTLINQLGTYKYEMTSNGRIKIRSKEEMKKDGMKSPDRADALLIGFHTLEFVRQPRFDFNRTDGTPVRRDPYGWGQRETRYA